MAHGRRVRSPRKSPDLVVKSARPLPRNGNGKVRKNELREMVAAWLVAGSPRGAGLTATAARVVPAGPLS